MPLHIKASDQAGIQGTPIFFDPVGTNEHIKNALLQMSGWLANIPIPQQFDFLGTDVTFGKGSVIAEVQFSNYPFLLNNAIRSELFFKARTPLTGVPMDVVIIITKGKMFPASNSTLYYEQAQRQLAALVKNNVFDVPIRLVGLLEQTDGIVDITFTTYSVSRYSRTVALRSTKQCRIQPEGQTEVEAY